MNYPKESSPDFSYIIATLKAIGDEECKLCILYFQLQKQYERLGQDTSARNADQNSTMASFREENAKSAQANFVLLQNKEVKGASTH